MIPKVIHYCWFGRKEKPQQVVRFIEGWKQKLPNYTIKEWNEDNFDVNSCDFTREAYIHKKYAFVSDVARLYALFVEGGIYMDTDVEVIKSFDDLLHESFLIGYEQPHTIGTGFIGASQGDLVISQFLNEYKIKHFVNSDASFSETPNTTLISNFLIKNNISVKIYPIDYFCAKNYITGNIQQTPNTYCIHHYAASWKPWYAKIEMTICHLLKIKYRDFLFRHFSKL